MLIIWTFYSSKYPEKKVSLKFPQKNIKKFIIIRNVSWAENQRIRMVSEESDTELSTDAENSALHDWNKLHFKIY